MLKVALLNVKGEKIKDIELNEEIFGIEPNDAVLHNAVILARASLRQGTHDTKTRSEVRGGGRKPWKQKGTGRARQGSIRAPHFRGGGIVFGPTPRSYNIKMNKKERRLAFNSALTYKVNEEGLMIIDGINLDTNKTKDMLAMTKDLNIVNDKNLIVIAKENANVALASRNLPNIKTTTVNNINILDVLNADKLIFDYEELKKIEKGEK